MAFNRFGAVFTSVVTLYPGSAAADFGGQVTIEEAIDRAVDRILAATPQMVHDQLASPDLILLVQRATAGQTAATFPLLPGIAGTGRIWVNQPSLFQERPQQFPAKFQDIGRIELDPTLYSINYTTGVVTLNNGMVANDQMYGTYDVDVTNASYLAPSLARMAVRGAASELGSRLYSEANQEWLLVDKYEKSFSESLENLSDGSWIPEELRFLKWWKEVERNTVGGASSLRLQRG